MKKTWNDMPGWKKFFFLGRRQLVFQLSGFPTFLISESHLGQKTGWVPLVPLRFVGSSNIWNIWIPPFPVLLVLRWYIAQGYSGWGFQQTIRAFPHILSCGIYLSRYTQYLFITIVRYHSLLEFVKRKDHCFIVHHKKKKLKQILKKNKKNSRIFEGML